MSEGETAETGGGGEESLAETAVTDSQHDAVACGKQAGVDGSSLGGARFSGVKYSPRT